ncbi:MAG: YCF48-related protein, partial [Bacteroidota bacterium]|nr:YCF48-related protein [Bacteroidota bacterium]
MKLRYTLFAFSLLFITASASAQTAWNWYNPTPQGNDLRCVVVKADTFGIAVGDAGTTMRRTSGVFQNPIYPVTSALGGICYYKDTVWVCGDGGVIYRSINNGATWSDQSYTSKSKVNFHACADLSKTNLWMAGDSGIILYSTNSGIAWTKQSNTNKNNINAIANSGRPNVYAVGDNGTILQALNYGGFGYYAITTPHKFAFHGVAIDSAQAFIVGDSSYILHRDVPADLLISDTIMNGGANVFYDVALADPYVIVVGANGTIRRSTDDGTTWSAPVSGATEKLYKVALSADFLTSGIAWVVGENGVFLKTANYGSTWSRLDSGVRGTVYAAAISPNGEMYATSIVGNTYRLKNNSTHWTRDSLNAGGAPRLTDICFDKNGFGLIATYDINVLRSIDSGRTWKSSLVNASATQILGTAVWGLTGLACAANGIVYRSGNKGGSWSATTTNNTKALYDVDMSGSNAIAVGSNGAVIYSLDGGSTWAKPNSSGTTAQLNKVRFFTNTNAIAVSSTGIIIRTVDKGVTWATVASGVTTPLNDVAFHDDKNGIITGDGGIILKTNDAGKTWTKDQSNTRSDLKGAIIVDGTTAYVAGSKTSILGTTNSALPVELMSFTGRRISSGDVVLDWTVANERDNFGYSVERQSGDRWQQTGFRSGMGTTMA